MTNSTQEQEHTGRGFAFGLMAGTCVGAGLAMWFAPRAAAELRHRVSASFKTLGDRATASCQDGGARVGAVVDTLIRQGDAVRDEVAESVARGAHDVALGAHQVERFARSSKSGRG